MERSETKLKLELVPITREIEQKKGMYRRCIEQFLQSGEDVLEVKYESSWNAYMGLRNWIKKLGLRDRVYVQKDRNIVQLKLR